MSALLEISNISKRFGGLQALNDVNVTIQCGEILGLIGPNGAGKTTLFSTLVGLLKPSTGSVRLEGREMAGMKPHRIAAAGMVKTFQNVALFLDSSVLDNVLTGHRSPHARPQMSGAGRTVGHRRQAGRGSLLPRTCPRGSGAGFVH